MSNKYIFHVHTYRCGHAEMVSDEEYIKKAIELKADSITFTDHAPFPADPFNNRMKYSELNEYISTLQALKVKYEDNIAVKIGLEIEYLPSFKSYYEYLKGLNNLDVLLLGQHFCEIGKDKYLFELDKEEIKRSEYLLCGEAIKEAIGTNLFEVIAHPDRIFRSKSWDLDCDKISEEIVTLANKEEIILEKNLSSMKKDNYYRSEFWDIAKVSKTIYGYDAHRTSEMEMNINDINV